MNIAQLRMEAYNDASAIAFRGPTVPVDLIDGEFVVQARPMDKERMRLIPRAKHSRKDDLWRLPAFPPQWYVLNNVFGGNLVTTTAVDEMVLRFDNWRETQEQRRAGELTDYPFSDHLFDFQETGVSFLLGAGSALLGDQMGTGKTIQGTEFMRQVDLVKDHGYHLVVCPNSMKFKWKSEIEKFWPEAEAIVINGTASQRRKAIDEGTGVAGAPVVYIINYKSLTTHTKLKPNPGKVLTEAQKTAKEFNDFEWQTVLLDEAHKIKGHKNLLTMAVKQMGAQAEHRIAMTGTALVNNPDDLHSIMEFVMPNEYGSLTQFRSRWCDTSVGWHGGMENRGLRADRREEFDKMFEPRFIRRTLKEVAPEMAEMLPIQYRSCTMSKEQGKVYKSLVDELFAIIDDELLVTPNPLSLSGRLRQASCATPIVEDGEVIGLGKKSCKLDAIFEILEEDPDEPLVIYAESRKLLEFFAEELEEAGKSVGMITGKIGAALREEYVNAFQAGKLDIILINDAGAEGLTLTRAAKIIIAQQNWSWAVTEQVIFRIWRIGQEREVLPIVLVTEDTVDLSVMEVNIAKNLGAQDVFRDKTFFMEAMHGKAKIT